MSDEQKTCGHCGRNITIQVGPGHYIHTDPDPSADIDDRTSTKPYRHHAGTGTGVKVLRITPYFEVDLASLNPDEGSLLADLQKTVGGYIEAVSPAEGDWVLYCNEEGKLQGLPVNRLATTFINELMPGFAQRDVLVGTVVFVGSTPSGGSKDVPADIVRRFEAMIGESLS